MAPSTTRLSEARAAETTFHVALMMMGARAYLEARQEWVDVVPVTGEFPARQVARWQSAMMQIFRLRRRWARDLSIPHIRLQRALITGSTVDTRAGRPVDLNDLRDDFEDAIRKFAPEALETSLLPDLDPDDTTPPQRALGPTGEAYKPYKRSSWTDAVKVEVDSLDELEDLWAKEEERAGEEIDDILKSLSENLYKAKLEKIKTDRAAVADKLRKEAHDSVGRQLAAHAQRVSMNGGRYNELDTGLADKKVQAFARVHNPHDDAMPCGFCAMLLSRGAVYKSARSAGGDVNGHSLYEFHSLDHCRAVALYVGEDYNSDPRFAVNRIFTNAWNRGAWKNMQGEKALDQWRRWIRAKTPAKSEGTSGSAQTIDALLKS